jgi:prepilin-type N-terminal cleavage/methylation domain-containing protein
MSGRPLRTRPDFERARSGGLGFTLIELALVVAIIGALTSVAIPLIGRTQLKAKAAESRVNLSAIRNVEEAYFADSGVYVSALPVTPAAIGPVKVAWGLAPGDSHGFNDLGFRPDGRVHFQYGVTTDGDSAFTIEARSDLDGDGVYNTWGFVKPALGTSLGVPGPLTTCPNTGAFDPETGAPNRLDTVGPCDPSSRTSVY